MNAYAQAQRGYSPTQAPIKTARDTEYEVIARISHRLKAAMKSKDFPSLAAAIHENNRLWMALGTDAVNPDNLLSDELRARIVYLSDFTRQHSQKVLRRTDTAIPLLEINAAILRGLKQEGTSQ